MTKRTALCLVDTDEQAHATVAQLTAAGFSQDDISVLFPDKGSTKEFAHQKETKLPEGATVGASTGGVLGGTVGLLAGLGALAIPGLGPFIAAGPLDGCPERRGNRRRPRRACRSAGGLGHPRVRSQALRGQ